MIKTNPRCSYQQQLSAASKHGEHTIAMHAGTAAVMTHVIALIDALVDAALVDDFQVLSGSLELQSACDACRSVTWVASRVLCLQISVCDGINMLCLQVSDLDGTMVGNGPEADAMTRSFTHYWENTAVLRNSVLVYNTGRSLGQFTSLYQEKAGALALPNVLITAVGTKVNVYILPWLLDIA